MKIFTIIVVLIFSSAATASKFAEFVGAYLVDANGECKSTILFGSQFPDSNYDGVCIPVTSIFDKEKKDIIFLAVTELKHPEMLESVIQYEIAKRQPTEAYEVKIDKHNDDIFKLVDGSVLEKTGSGYVGYVSYHKEAILYKDGTQWKLCVNDTSFNVNILKYVKHNYSKDSITGKSVLAIESMDECS